MEAHPARGAPLEGRCLLIADGVGEVFHAIGLCFFEAAENFEDQLSFKAAMPTWTKHARVRPDDFEVPVKVLVTRCRVIEPVAIRNTRKEKWRISTEERAQVLNSVVVGTGQRLGEVDVQARSCLVWTLNPRCRSDMGLRATLEKMAAELRQQRHSEWAMDRQVARGMGIDMPREPAYTFHTLHRQPGPADDEDGENEEGEVDHDEDDDEDDGAPGLTDSEDEEEKRDPGNTYKITL